MKTSTRIRIVLMFPLVLLAMLIFGGLLGSPIFFGQAVGEIFVGTIFVIYFPLLVFCHRFTSCPNCGGKWFRLIEPSLANLVHCSSCKLTLKDLENSEKLKALEKV